MDQGCAEADLPVRHKAAGEEGSHCLSCDEAHGVAAVRRDDESWARLHAWGLLAAFETEFARGAPSRFGGPPSDAISWATASTLQNFQKGICLGVNASPLRPGGRAHCTHGGTHAITCGCALHVLHIASHIHEHMTGYTACQSLRIHTRPARPHPIVVGKYTSVTPVRRAARRCPRRA